MMKDIEMIKSDWYGRLEELVEAIEEAGMEIEESNSEYIVASYEENGEDVQVEFRLGGTESTITVVTVNEVYRG